MSRELFKRSCKKRFVWLLQLISISVISWCFIIRYKRSIRQLLVWKYQFCHKISKCFHWGFKRNVLTTFIRAVILLLFLFLVIFQKILSSQDLTFHRVSFRNNIYIYKIYIYFLITYFKLLGIIQFPFSWGKMRHCYWTNVS